MKRIVCHSGKIFVIFLTTIPWILSLDPLAYVNLISEFYWRFNGSTVFLFHHDFGGLNDSKEIHEAIRLFSAMGILVASANFEKSEVRGAVSRSRTRPLIAVILQSHEEFHKFADFTGNFEMTRPVWLLIVDDTVNLRKLAGLREKNIFHLTFNSEMFIYWPKSKTMKEYYAIHEELRIVDFATWNYKSGLVLLSNQSLFARRRNLEGSSIVVASTHDPPIIVYQNHTIGGFLGGIVAEIISFLNLEPKYVTPKENGYGRWNATAGRWVGMVGLLASGQADISGSPLAMSETRMEVVDFTSPVLFATSKLIIRHPESESRWSGYVKIFTPKIWMAIVISILLSSILLTIAAGVGGVRVTFDSLIEHCVTVLGIYCGQSASGVPNSLPLKIACLSTSASALVVSAAFSASLTSFLAATGDALPFTSLEGFVEDGSYKLITLRNSVDREMLKSPTDPLFAKLSALMKPESELPTTLVEGFRQVCNEKVAFFAQTLLKEIISNYPQCKLVDISTSFGNSLAVGLSKKNPYFRIINFYIQHVRHDGTYHHLKQMYLPKMDDPPPKIYAEITVRDIAPILIFLAAGATLAVAVLFVELFYEKKFVSVKP